MIKIHRLGKQYKHEFRFVHAKNLGVIFIGLGFIGIEIDYGFKKRLAAVQAQFKRNCLVCGKPLKVNSLWQKVYYHKECRKHRHKIKHVKPA